ncbi:hypothetical protein JKG68_26370 [Microvirga aerilata]|uniref:Calcium-binding protein n=1 Tax=Microvirga aerilata TaxID=670292 RepID=A0A937D326_9HYPH|nr:calcium-binding protein [Microvirga aerilata]MBL0407447.1 hypothetical protein [Microvirga aerilata]
MADLTKTMIGKIGDTTIYRVDLGQSGLDSIKAITIADDNIISGGSGTVSGFDLDFLKLSSSGTLNASAVASLASENAFNFTSAGVVLQPGFLRPVGSAEDSDWRKPYLSGTDGNTYSASKATLDTLDGSSLNDTGSISLGESGQITFHLNYAVSTGAKYLYIGERGGGNDEFLVKAFSADVETPQAPIASGIHLIGTQGNDTIRLGQGLNRHLGAGNDTIEGLGGRDVLGGAGGDDTIHGGAGSDKLYGEGGEDWLHGGSLSDTINGGAGNDLLYGGVGRDIFVFSSKLGTSRTDRKVNFDKIADFSVRDDSVWLDNAIFKKIGSGSSSKPGKLNKEFFTVDSRAREKDDYLVYNKKTGVLRFDADGSGSKVAVEVAQFKKGLALTFKDFFVI